MLMYYIVGTVAALNTQHLVNLVNRCRFCKKVKPPLAGSCCNARSAMMLLVLPALLGALAVAAADAQQPPELVEQYTAAFSANLSAAGLLPFPHFWEECVGSSHMALGTRADWRAHLKKVRDACGFKRIRGHGLLDNDMDIILSNSPARCQGCTGRAAVHGVLGVERGYCVVWGWGWCRCSRGRGRGRH